MLLSAMLFFAAQESDRVAALMAAYRERTRVAPRCNDARRRDDEIVVCSDREADRRYRVPFVPPVRARDSVPMRTAALLDEHRAPCGEGAFLVRCGKAGVSATMTFGAGSGSGSWHVETERKRAN